MCEWGNRERCLEKKIDEFEKNNNIKTAIKRSFEEGLEMHDNIIMNM